MDSSAMTGHLAGFGQQRLPAVLPARTAFRKDAVNGVALAAGAGAGA